MAAQFNSGGYISEQFPSQYHKKLKAKLGSSVIFSFLCMHVFHLK